KVLHIASSNSTGEMIATAEGVSSSRQWARFTGEQIEWSLLVRAVEADVVPAAQVAGLGIIPYFPLASGVLTGKYRHGEAFPEGSRLAASSYFTRWATEENFAKVDRYIEYAARTGHSVTELAIAWLLAQPTVTSVIAGATKPEQIAANVAAAAWTL